MSVPSLAHSLLGRLRPASLHICFCPVQSSHGHEISNKLGSPLLLRLHLYPWTFLAFHSTRLQLFGWCLQFCSFIATKPVPCGRIIHYQVVLHLKMQCWTLWSTFFSYVTSRTSIVCISFNHYLHLLTLSTQCLFQFKFLHISHTKQSKA